VRTDQWYFVEISWSADGGLEVYVDREQVAESRQSTSRKNVDDAAWATPMRLCVGCLNAPKNASAAGGAFQRTAPANAIVDELLICYGSCAKLTEFEFLQRGR